MKFTIQGRLNSLNEYIKACRGNVYSANNMKMYEKAIREAVRVAKLMPIDKYPISLKITWYEPNSRRDIDNVQFATKFILDAMVEMQIIKNDSQKVCERNIAYGYSR